MSVFLLRTIQLAGVEFLVVSVSTPDQCVHFIRGKIGELALDKSCRLFLGDAVAIVHTSQAMQVVVPVAGDVLFGFIVIIVQSHH